MEDDTEEIQEVIKIGEKAPLPRPISRRDCECGCGHEFQPLRKDQIYLNKQHADFGYNHGKRKRKNLNRKNIEKILLKNDNILKKHYNSDWNNKEVDCHYDVLIAEGFDLSYHVSSGEDKNKNENEYGYNYYFSYNYSYYIHVINEFIMINITKIKKNESTNAHRRIT
jgi:hypothetical protein